MTKTLLEKYRREARQIINRLVREYHFGEVLNNCTQYEFNQWRDKDYTYDACIDTACGETKLVLIPTDADFVIKIGFDTDIDYAMLEARHYAAAIRCGVAEDFAWCFKIGGGYSGVIQEKCTCDYEDMENTIRDYFLRQGWADEDSCSSDFGDSDCVDELLQAEFDDYCAFATFCDENQIGDVHSANIGYSDDNGLVVVDYSGYCVDVDEFEAEVGFWDIMEEVEGALAA